MGDQTDGGAAAHAWEVGYKLTELGKSVFFISQGTSHKRSRGFHSFCLKAKSRTFGRLTFYLQSILLAKKLDKKYEIDIFLSRSLPTLFLFNLFFQPSKKIILEMNGIWSDEFSQKVSRPFQIFSLLLKKLELFAFNKASAIICVSKGLYNYVLSKNIPKHKVSVIENGVNISKFYPLPEKENIQFKRSLNLQGRKIITFVGKIEPWQDLGNLIRFFKEISEKDKEFCLMIIGSGSQLGKMRNIVNSNKISDEVLFLGHIEHNLIPKYLNISDLCLISRSLKEKPGVRSPLKLFEYFACGKPVIAFYRPEFKFIQKYDLGLLIDEHNFLTGAKSVISFLSSERYSHFSNECINRTKNYYSWASRVKEINKLIVSLL